MKTYYQRREYEKWIYYHRDKTTKGPVVTVVLLRDPYGIIARGTAICSKKDQPNKRYGRALATLRALRAMHMNPQRTDVIVRNEVAEVFRHLIPALPTHRLFSKSELNPPLTSFERRLLGLEV